MMLSSIPTLLIGLISLAATQSRAGITADDIVAKHRESVTKLQALVVEVKTTSNHPGACMEYVWTWEGKRERCRLRYMNEPETTGEMSGMTFRRGFRDACNGPDGYRLLKDFDPDNPYDLEKVVDHPAEGQIGPFFPAAQSVLADCRSEVGLTIEHQSRRTVPLWEVMREATSVRVKRSTEDADTQEHYEIQIETPDAEHEIQLDPQSGYLANYIRTKMKGQNGFFTKSVKSFQHLGDDLYFPSRIETLILDQPGDEDPIKLNSTVHVLSVNRELPKDAFEVRFPRGLVVYDRDERKICIWGDGSPSLRFNTKDDFTAWDAERKVRIAAGHSKWRTMLGVAVAVAVCIVVVVTVVRRRM